jgi:hypothetical protein
LNECIISAGAYFAPKNLVDSYAHQNIALNLMSSIPMDCSAGLCKELLFTEDSKQKSAQVKFHLKISRDLMNKYMLERAELKK